MCIRVIYTTKKTYPSRVSSLARPPCLPHLQLRAVRALTVAEGLVRAVLVPRGRAAQHLHLEGANAHGVAMLQGEETVGIREPQAKLT